MSSKSDTGSVQQFINETEIPLFVISGGLTALFVVLYLIYPNQLTTALDQISTYLYTNLAWAYLWAMLICVIFCVYLLIGPWGDIRFGGQNATPDYSFLSYFAMFISAGIAAGVVFWGPAEAITHFETVPPLIDTEAQSSSAMIGAIQYAMFHYGFSAWCSFLVFAVPIAYFHYNRGTPMRASVVLAPLLGTEGITDHPLAKAFDIIVVFASLGAISASLGFVGQQMLTGISYNWGLSFSDIETVAIIAGLTVLFTVSVASGVQRGVRVFSRINVYGFLLVMAFTFIAGPTWMILNVGSEAFGRYMGNFVNMSLYTGGGENLEWVGNWTVFYWAWWFAFAPIVGIFYARISKGRTIREMVFTGVVATSLTILPWFTVLGVTSMVFQRTGRADILGTINEYGVAVSGFPLFESLPLGEVVLLFFIGLIITFFVTTADSTSLGISILIANGKSDPSFISRTFWAINLGLLASILVVTGGTGALQSAAIIAGGPIALFAVIAVIGLIWEFYNNYNRDTQRIQVTTDSSDSDVESQVSSASEPTDD